ncbi:hypothetical protein [Mucilaginibacter sp.]|uniref:WD40/YVTN/BNR-like repeat-containing protein n=1 Tax=Mucilaginibacter sp. TaxID=1882438 RepID=UPI00260BF2EC|nr:hypothetical protein [Mucilaginibacter sp.]MDB4918607.1 hypothetical protein [Mucilaginibacter sp.]
MFIICSCERNNLSFKKFHHDTINQKPQIKRITWEQALKEAEKDRAIYGAFEPSKNTIVLFRRFLGIELSTNGGKSWEWLAKKLNRLDEITIDNKGIWWGLVRWKGIHEASHCRIFKSADCGKTWDGYIFNTNVFFPYHIYSKPNQAFLVINFWDKKVYSLLGNDPQHHWQYVKQLPKEDEMADISADNYFIDRHDNKLYVKRKGGKTDTLMDFRKAYEIYQIQKINDTIYVAGPALNNADSYFATVAKEHILKEYVIPGLDLNITKTQFNHIFLTATTGAYLLKNDKLIHIFK